ncbi:MAG: serine/threonine protein kinase [Planctomycetaceae bacterium]|nr:serine/threonine protein kinase [Planctomycetaceae bacterium]
MNPQLLRRISEEFEKIEMAIEQGQEIQLDALYLDLQGEDRQTALAETQQLLEELRQSRGIFAPWISAASMSARYEPVEPVKQGGMGEIWIAIDQDFDRQVAIKEILPETANDLKVRQRFLRESQITAKLEHPGILPVYSKGNHADGRPFYVMRWVSGEGSQSLHDAINSLHCHENTSDQIQRIQLHELLNRFISVCQTVAFAHHANFVHRDLKPANILLGPFGETFVVDWGLAMDLSHPEMLSTDESTTRNSEDFFGTPGYAAPECLEDPKSATPRSDIFSLGMILYQVCAGDSPFTRTQKKTPDSLKTALAMGTLPRLRQINPSIHPALEAICDKASAFDPKTRYSTAKDLAADVSRYLNNEPTEAWPEPWNYRAKRWLHRKTATIATLTVATLLMLAGALGYSWISYRHNSELSRKSKQLEESLQAEAQYKLNALEAADVAIEREKLATRAIVSFWSQVARDPRLRFSDELRDLRDSLLEEPMEYYRTLSESYQDAAKISSVALANFVDSRLEFAKLQLEGGDWDAAGKNLEQTLHHIEQALSSASETDDSWLYRHALAIKTLARIYANQGDHARSKEMHQAFEEIEVRIAKRDHLPADLEVLLAESTLESARFLGEQNDYSNAVAKASSALDRAESLCRRFPDEPRFSILKEKILNDSALIDLRQGEFKLARDKFHQILKLLESSEYPSVESSGQAIRKRIATEEYNRQFRLAAIEFNLGVVALRLGQMQKAFEHHSRALKIRETLADRLPNVSEFQKALGHSYLALSEIYMRRSQKSEGIERYRDWVQVNRLLYARQETNLPQKMELASALHQLGHFEQEQGNKQAAMTIYAEALPLAIEVKDSRPDDPVWKSHRYELSEHLATLFLEEDRLQEAYDQFDQVIEGQENLAMRPQAILKDRDTYRTILSKMMSIAERLGDIEKQDVLQRKRTAFEAIEKQP